MSTNHGQILGGDKQEAIAKELEAADPTDVTEEVEGSEETVAEESKETPASPAAATPAAPTPKTYTEEEYKAALKDATEKAAVERSNQQLMEFAKQGPVQFKMVYGIDPPPGTFPDEQKPVDPKAPVDPNAAIQAKITQIEKWKAEQERQAYVGKVQDEAETHMERHKAVFTDDAYGELAQKVYAQKIIDNPRGNLAQMADEVAAQMKALEEKTKAKYLGGKKEVAKAVVPGAGKAGGAIPGQAPERLKLGQRGKGGTAAALAARLAQSDESQSD